MRLLQYNFKPAIEKSLHFATLLDRKYFYQYSELRNHIERSYFIEAAGKLSQDDIGKLQLLCDAAKNKLNDNPIHIPHQEHKGLHLLIYKRLVNVFVMGILEAYWSIYEAIGLDLYTDFEYLEKVWQYHQDIVRAIKEGDLERGFDLLIKHMELLYQR